MSHWTAWLNSVDSLVAATALGGGLVQHLQIRQVATMSLINLRASGGAPAVFKRCIILAAEACHSRMCSRRNAILTTAGLREFSVLIAR